MVFLRRLQAFSFRFSAQGAISEPAELLTEHSEHSQNALGAFTERTLVGGGPENPNKTQDTKIIMAPYRLGPEAPRSIWIPGEFRLIYMFSSHCLWFYLMHCHPIIYRWRNSRLGLTSGWPVDTLHSSVRQVRHEYSDFV